MKNPPRVFNRAGDFLVLIYLRRDTCGNALAIVILNHMRRPERPRSASSRDPLILQDFQPGNGAFRNRWEHAFHLDKDIGSLSIRYFTRLKLYHCASESPMRRLDSIIEFDSVCCVITKAYMHKPFDSLIQFQCSIRLPLVINAWISRSPPGPHFISPCDRCQTKNSTERQEGCFHDSFNSCVCEERRELYASIYHTCLD